MQGVFSQEDEIMIKDVIKPINPLDQFIKDGEIMPPYSLYTLHLNLELQEDIPILSTFFSLEHLNSISNIEEIKRNLFRPDSCLNQSCVIDRSKNQQNLLATLFLCAPPVKKDSKRFELSNEDVTFIRNLQAINKY